MVLQEQAEQYQKDRETEHQMKMMELDLLAAEAGVTDIWEVELKPRGGGYSTYAVVSGRNSDIAARAARAKYPNYNIVGVAKLNR